MKIAQLAIAMAPAALARKALVNEIKAAKDNLAKFIEDLGYESLKSGFKTIQDAIDNSDEVDSKLTDLLTGAVDGDLALKSNCEGPDCQTGNLNLEALFGYGCWCFFGRIDSALGRGPPVDAYDATCQKMALCYRCIFVDAENEGDDECDPFQTEFSATISLNQIMGGGGSQNATTSCVTQNTDNCAWRTCSCAMTMITSFFNLSFDSQNPYDDNLKHNNGFDYNLECPQQGRAQDRQCCGFYPSRRTFDRHEARECCHDISIYNPLRHICCPDGSHIGLGHSC